MSRKWEIAAPWLPSITGSCHLIQIFHKEIAAALYVKLAQLKVVQIPTHNVKGLVNQPSKCIHKAESGQ